MKLIEALPEFSAELEACLSAVGREDVACQIKEVEIERYSYDDTCNAAYIYIKSPRPLNVVETNIIGLKHSETIPVEHEYGVNVDTDNFCRIRGIELLSGKAIADKLYSLGLLQ
jgi:hypothetical protein